MRLLITALICISTVSAGYVRNETVDQLLEDLLKLDSTDYKNDTCAYQKLSWVLNPYHGLSYRRLLLTGLMGKVCQYTARMSGVCSRTLSNIAVGKFVEIDNAVRYWKTLCVGSNRMKRRIYTWASKMRKAMVKLEEHKKIKKAWDADIIWPVKKISCAECVEGMYQFYEMVHRKQYEEEIVSAIELAFCEYVVQYRDVCNRVSKALVTEVRKYLEEWLDVRSSPLKVRKVFFFVNQFFPACLHEGFCHGQDMPVANFS